MKKLTILIICIIIIVGAIWYFQTSVPSIVPEQQTASVDPDATNNINKDLNAIEVGNSDRDFNSIKSDINSL
jgi:hypothetical protein